MYGRKGYQLLKDFASGEKGQLKPFNSKLFDETIEECDQNHHLMQSLMRKMQQEDLDVQNSRNADHYGALIHHLSLMRNKRCLMAYVYNRAEIVRDLAWRVGLELLDLPSEIQEKLTSLEKEYFKNHSVTLKSYMGKVGIELNVDMVPPKDPYIKVRILDDIDEGIVLSDKTTNFARHSMHFLKRTDAEPYIARVSLFLIPSLELE
ncbi:PREDICTED: probable DNA replication complex GINS protein PSF1 isoform X1 [Camelina sativa]|uniref:Probable DNA replication complex GINS protein PSF1 isoform X1 n=1 Tax=Camelina sativa TaxID=90675 RepID=A0ABM1R445_CAMSA|nr:PREDICTED: probable DNA replication complex GINS protein PSF1 isoform X1 [Camelina sativa]XP_019093784.1 PREDICTED: probable DNA replication complex GINS protein PSF1 isoform X1 [Camelina sativa]